MEDLRAALVALRRSLRRLDEPESPGEVVTHLERIGDAARAVGLMPGLEALVAGFRGFSGLADEERAVLHARAQRLVATLQARIEEPEAPSARPAVPQRPSRPVAAADPLCAPVETVRGVGAKIAERLRGKGIENVGDLLRLLPLGYLDHRRGGRVGDLALGEPGFAVGEVVDATSMGYGRRRGFRLRLEDESGALTCVWFRAHGGMSRIRRGDRVRVAGTAREGREGLELHHPELEILPDDAEAGPAALPIVPRYPEIEGVPPRLVWRLVREALPVLEQVPDPLPAGVREDQGLPDLADALRTVHAPPGDVDMEALAAFRHPSQRRLIFEELFAMQLAIARAAGARQRGGGVAFRGRGDLEGRLRERLPFDLTAAQVRVFDEIRTEMCAPTPMSRLLQGDVGSGKTVVALLAAMVALEDGHQAAILAPTEVLAQQHFETMTQLVAPLGVSTALVTSALKGARRRAVREEIRSGLARLVVGTQALLYESVEFDALGLCVVDEQHRFGVLQRAALVAKGPGGATPDLLVMTATPIPRTLAMTVYGDLQVSVLDEKPPGRVPVTTTIARPRTRDRLYERVRVAVEGGAQAFVVVPLVEESATLDVRDAISTWEELSTGPLAGLPVGLLHGRLGADEKRTALERFRRGEDRVLVCTTVMEVGVDVPAATHLVVEHAERFGLAQLHQLRGRVGRGGGNAWCVLLLGGNATPQAALRLGVLAETDDGFRIAESDLALRGPGEILGTIQSGRPALLVSDLRRDGDILARAREAAFALVARDPELVTPENERAWEMLAFRYGPLLELTRIA